MDQQRTQDEAAALAEAKHLAAVMNAAAATSAAARAVVQRSMEESVDSETTVEFGSGSGSSGDWIDLDFPEEYRTALNVIITTRVVDVRADTNSVAMPQYHTADGTSYLDWFVAKAVSSGDWVVLSSPADTGRRFITPGSQAGVSDGLCK